MDEATGGNAPGRLRGRAAARLHLTLAAGLTLCLVGFGIETWRAFGGNTLSWVYVFEWPLLAAFALYLWWNLLHGYDRRSTTPAEESVPTEPVSDPEDAEALARWNRYLATLDEEPR